MTDGPLTDAERDGISERATHGVWLTATREDVLRLVSEIRRLRSDWWLLRAAEEAGFLNDEKTLNILRKHRDDKR